MREFEQKLTELNDRIEKIRSKNVSATRLVVVAYVILVVFVFGYTSFLMRWIKLEVSADQISAQMRLQLEENLLTDKKRQQILAFCRGRIPMIADSIAVATHQKLMPAAKTKIKSILSKQADLIAKKTRKEMAPEIMKFVADHAAEFQQHSDVADEKIAVELAKVLSSDMEKEMDGVINDKVKHRISALRTELHAIAAKPYAKLTKKEAAERRLIVNWVFLMEHGEAPSDVFGSFLQSLGDTYRGFMSDMNLQ